MQDPLQTLWQTITSSVTIPIHTISLTELPATLYSGSTTLLQRAMGHTPARAPAPPPTDLFTAAMNHNIALVRQLLERGAAADGDGSRVYTPLWCLAAHASRSALAIVELLVEHGADATKHQVNGQIPLHIAVRYGCSAMARFFIEECGANIDAKDQNGQTPYQIFLEQVDHSQTNQPHKDDYGRVMPTASMQSIMASAIKNKRRHSSIKNEKTAKGSAEPQHHTKNRP